jgi:hypothetical protein
VPASASAAPAAFEDRVLDAEAVDRVQARAAQSGREIEVPTSGGYSVTVSFASPLAPDPALAQSYVGFLDQLPHGDELDRLNMVIAPANRVARLCGGTERDGILACYSARGQEMVVPSTGLEGQTDDGGYSVAYVLTHEYGHHVAANRNNQGFVALNYGPKYWASYELVCDRAIREKLVPGDEASDYRRNPGEAWAEAYARLTFPDQEWTFTDLLRPDAAALDAARRDVLEPWTKNATATFVMPAGRRTQSFRLPITLDGRLKAVVRGQRGSDVGVVVRDEKRQIGRSKHRGGRNQWTMRAGCRERQTETLTFKVTRRSGGGPVRLVVSYPG